MKINNKKIKFLFIFLCLFPIITEAQNCSCTATTAVSNQQRTKAKHADNYNDFIQKQDTITVSYIYKWQNKYSSYTQTITVNPNSPASYRKHNTPEDTLYILKGYMWFVKTEGNDCDFHIEIGPKSPTGTRVVVEIPKENTALQSSVKQYLDDLGLKILNCNISNSANAHFQKGLPVIVTGLGFYDASHKPNTNHGDAHTKKYSWELHPVKDIVFL